MRKNFRNLLNELLISTIRSAYRKFMLKIDVSQIAEDVSSRKN